jgi:dimethylhistidine N-methyltransferase
VQLALPAAGSVAAELRASLAASKPAIAPRFFYDDLGSRLFAAITALDEYYPTRVEAQLLRDHLPAIARAAPVTGCTFVDVGAGNCEKAASLLRTVAPAHYVAVDISHDYLRGSLAQLRLRFPALRMLGVATDFSSVLRLPEVVPAQQRLFFYPGSSIGNFTPPDAVRFLASLRENMDGDGVLWIGVDLVKARDVLERAYDDALGVTAAFNRNVLRNVNRLAGTDFVLDDWRHVAFFAERESRIEMHLEAVRDVAVSWPGGGRRFAAGERIHTEHSYKHTIAGFRSLLAEAGLATAGHWTDDARWFAFFVARPA